MPARGAYRGGVEQTAAIRQCPPDPVVLAEDRRHQPADLAHTGAGQLPGVGPQFARLVPIDQFQGQRDVAAILGKAGRLRRVAHLEFGVIRAFGNAGQVAHRAHQGAGDVMQAIKVFLHAYLLPPVVACPAQFLPGVHHQFVQRVLDQAAKIGRGGQADTLRVITAVQKIVAGKHQVKLPDARKPRSAHALQALGARQAEKVIHRCLQALAWLHHAFHAPNASDCLAALQLGQQSACLAYCPAQLRRTETAVAELFPDAFLERVGQAALFQGVLQQKFTQLALFRPQAGQLRLQVLYAARARFRGRVFRSVFIDFFHLCSFFKLRVSAVQDAQKRAAPRRVVYQIHRKNFKDLIHLLVFAPEQEVRGKAQPLALAAIFPGSQHLVSQG